jgi:hypothetical protein
MTMNGSIQRVGKYRLFNNGRRECLRENNQISLKRTQKCSSKQSKLSDAVKNEEHCTAYR